MVERADGGLEVGAGVGSVGVSAGEVPGGTPELAWVGGVDSSGREIELAVGWEGSLPAAVIDGPQAVFDDAVTYGNSTGSGDVDGNDQALSVDVEVVARADGFTHNTVLGQAPGGGVDLRFPLTMTAGLHARVSESGVLEVVDGSDGVVFSAPAPLAWDSDGAYVSVEAEFEVSPEGGQVLVLRVPGGWLDNPERVFPVTVDPTWVSSQVGTLWIHEPAQSGQVFNGFLVVGRGSGSAIGRAYLTFDWNAALLAGMVVERAELSLTQIGVESCAYGPTRQVEARRVTGLWHPLGIRWNNEPPSVVDGDPAEFVVADCGQTGSPLVKLDLTETVQQWANGAGKYGISLRAGSVGEDTADSAVYFASALSPAQGPSLTVTYAPPVALGSIQGTLKDVNNALVSGGDASLWKWPADDGDLTGPPELVAEVKTNSLGVYKFIDVLPGSYSVIVGGESYVREYVPGTPVLDEATVFDLNGQSVSAGVTTLDLGSGVVGLVQNSSDQPIEGLTVVAMPLISGVSGEVLTGQAETDADGAFQIHGLAPGNYSIFWLGDGEYLPTSQVGIPEQLILPYSQVVSVGSLHPVRGAVLNGQVFGLGGSVVPGVSIKAERLGGTEPVSAGLGLVDANGFYELRGLAPGSYQVVADGTDTLLGARLTDGSGTPINLTVVEETTTQVEPINLSLGATVTGSVATADPATTLGGLKVVAFQQVSTGEGLVSWEAIKSGVTGTDGLFSVPGLPPGPTLVFINGGESLVGRYGDGAATEETAVPVDLTPPGVVDVGQVLLPPAAVVSGEVLDEDGSALVNSPVFVYDASPGGSVYPVDAGQTDSDGQYQIGGLPTGDYEIVAAPMDLESDPEDLPSMSTIVNAESGENTTAQIIQVGQENQTATTYQASAASTAAAATPKRERWVLASYNTGSPYYGYKDWVPKTYTAGQADLHWAIRYPQVVSKIKATVATGDKAARPTVVALQEPLTTKPVTVGGQTTNQLAHLTSQLAPEYDSAITTTDQKAATPGDWITGFGWRPDNLDCHLFYLKAAVSVKAAGAYSGMQLVKAVDSGAVSGYRSMMGLKNALPKKIIEDRVFPWALFQKEGKTTQRNQFLVATSFHATPRSLVKPNLSGTDDAKTAKYFYYNTLITQSLAKKLAATAKTVKLGSSTFTNVPIAIAGDFNAHYEVKTGTTGVVRSSAPRVLEGLGYVDLRNAKTGCRQNKRKFSSNAHCSGQNTRIITKETPEPRIIDYIFVKYSGNLSVGKFHTKSDPKWYSDHLMIASDVLLGG